MDISPKDIIIPIVTAILGVALPLLLGVIQRIDEKYESTRLMKQFINERATKCFGGILVATVLLLFYLLIAPPNKNDFGIFTQYVNYSAVIIVTIACVLLCFSFFKVIWLIYIYHSPINLQERLLKGKIKIETRQAWFEFFVSMLKQDNVNVLSKGFDSLYEWCIELRKGNEWKEIKYPQEFYDGIIALNEKLCSQKKKVVSISNGNDALKIFFDDTQLTIIHPLTFNKIWIGLNQQLYYNRKDLILEYWGAAHQHFSFYMKQYYEGRRITHLNKTITITRKQAALRHKSRMDFKEFHIAFGGLLLYKKEYELLNHILFYTNTQPPVYHLIPGRLSEIIPVYMELLSFKLENVMKYESRYPFIDLHDGIRNDNIINGYIQRYLILTMFRLFKLSPAYTSDNFFELPELPGSLSDKQEWINSIPIIIEKLEKDTTILEMVEKILPMEAGELYMVKKKLILLSKSLLENLKTAMIQQKESLPLSQEKIQKFSHTISEMIEYEFSTYWSIFPQISVEDDAMPSNYTIYDALRIERKIGPTEAYADDQTMGYSNLNEALAQNIILELRSKWLGLFARQKSQSYNLTTNKVAEVLKKMNLNKEKHVILGFGVNWYSCFQELEKCDESKLVTSDGIVLYDLPVECNRDFNNVIVIMNKEDLPQLLFKKPEVLETEKYKLECINPKYNLYASILKLNENPDLLEKCLEIGTHTEKQLQQSVLISAEMNLKVAWRLNIKMVLIKISDSHKENDDLSNITSFENDEKMMKSRKEKTTRKRGLTSEEYIDKLNESKPDKNEWKELLKIAMETRKFEIELYWKRANYFWLFVAAFFVAYYQTIPSENKQTEVENILFIIGGYFFSIGWYLANRGSKYWQENWEKHIAVLSRHLKTPIFELLKSNENKIWELSKSYPYSVSRINQGLNIVVIFIWIVLFIYKIYSFGFYPFITTLAAVVILFATTRYALHFARSFVVREPTDHSKDFFLNDKVQIHKRK